MFEHGYALLIGVDQNKTPNLALPTVRHDIAKLEEVLTHPDRCGYAKENVRVVTGSDATRANILDGLDWLKGKLAADTDANQTAFLFYSGHGHREAGGEAFLIPYDFRFPVRTGGLAAADFAAIIDGIQPRRLLVALDCCHAAGMNIKDVGAAAVTPVALTAETPGMDLLTRGEGRAILSSSRGDQLSWIRKDGKMSVFTYHLVEALTGRAGRTNWPDVTVTEIMEYVGREVPRTALAHHAAVQQPRFDFSGTAFPVALILGGKGLTSIDAAPDPLAALPPILRSDLKVDEIRGKATNVDVDELNRGEIHATTQAGAVKEGGELIGARIRRLG